MNEAREIMRMNASDALALAEKAKAGAPGDVRRLTLYGAWLNIQRDRFIPAKKKARVFTSLCQEVDIEVVHGGR